MCCNFLKHWDLHDSVCKCLRVQFLEVTAEALQFLSNDIKGILSTPSFQGSSFITTPRSWRLPHGPPPSSPAPTPKSLLLSSQPSSLASFFSLFLLILSPLTPHLVSWINLTTRPKSSSASYFNFPTKFQSRGLGNTGICLLEGWGQVRTVNTCMMSLRVPSLLWDLGQVSMSGGCIFQGPDPPSITTILW